jgi:hypothetical protein
LRLNFMFWTNKFHFLLWDGISSILNTFTSMWKNMQSFCLSFFISLKQIFHLTTCFWTQWFFS